MNFYSKNLAGYKFEVLEFDTGYITYSAPMGSSPTDKKMFDDLVYHHNRLYNGKLADKDQIEANIIEFIKSYK